MHDTFNLLKSKKFPSIFRKSIDTLQINLGYKCNQSCFHCHVNASPDRKEIMQKDIVDDCLKFIDQNKIKSIDLTGGAPELNPHFRYLVRQAKKMQENFPKAPVTQTNAGHFLQEEVPTDIAEALIRVFNQVNKR